MERKNALAERLHVRAEIVKIDATVEEGDVSVIRFHIGFNGYIAVCKGEEEPQIYQRLGNDTYYRVIWMNITSTSRHAETYTAGSHKDVQELIDFYHFSKKRTRVYLDDGRDMTDDFYFNPENNDTLAK